jgi:hypothetical protein
VCGWHLQRRNTEECSRDEVYGEIGGGVVAENSVTEFRSSMASQVLEIIEAIPNETDVANVAAIFFVA